MSKVNQRGLKVHSTVDLITNSSTTIFTYSDKSVDAARALISSMLQTFSVDSSVDELFEITLIDNDDDGDGGGSVISIEAKDGSYSDLANKIVSFLYSTYAEEGYC